MHTYTHTHTHNHIHVQTQNTNQGLNACRNHFSHDSPPAPLVMMAFVLQVGSSPLIGASFYGQLDVVKTLLEAGANINQAAKVQ